MTKTVLLIINILHGLPNTTGRAPSLQFSTATVPTPITNRRERKFFLPNFNPELNSGSTFNSIFFRTFAENMKL